MKQLNFLIGMVLFYSFPISAQKVTNVSNRQEQSTIIVSYDLETKIPCKIALYVSTNGGKTWQGPLKKVTGDIGAKVNSGKKSISWSVLEEFEELRGNNIVFQVRAVNNTIETIQIVKIGTQEWTKKNLDVTTYRNGDTIPEVNDPNEWAKLTTGAWCYYDNDPKNDEIYGKLYNWYAVNDSRGLAPDGYHVPSLIEWDTLIDYLGGRFDAGGKMKEVGFNHWKSPNTEATNSSGFTGLPAGFRYKAESFNSIGNYCGWWSSSESHTEGAWHRNLYYYNGEAQNVFDYYKTCGFSVRCIRD
jgi:uncharacterized protein (TIGR02145 family)